MRANRLVMKFWEGMKKRDDQRIASLSVPAVGGKIEDVAYLADGNPMHRFDIYFPSGRALKPLPVIFDIHGGGWYYGDKDLNAHYCRALTAYGFATVSMSYRLAPETDIFGQMQDVFAALHFFFEHAEEYGVDPNAFFLAGDSAGGHLVSLVLALYADEALCASYGVTLPAFQPKAAALICPAADPFDLPLPRFLANLYYDPIFGKGHRKNGTAQLTSFSEHVNEKIPPCIFITAYGDSLRKSTRHSYEALKKAGVRAQLIDFDKPKVKGHKLTHVFNVLYWDWEESKEANERTCAFFRSVLDEEEGR